jgi:uncharacterized damage-inducible protein DinB
MDVSELLTDLFGRVDETVDRVLDGLDDEALTATVVPGTNPIGWLLWHTARVQDAQVADVAGAEQVWATGEWAPRFGLPPGAPDTGYGHGPDDVAAVRPDGVDALADYHRAVAARTRAYLTGMTPADLDRVVDERWDPPVTLGVRLISIVDDDIQHAGQAAYLKGLLAHR